MDTHLYEGMFTEVPMEMAGDEDSDLVLEEEVEEKPADERPAIPSKRRRFNFL